MGKSIFELYMNNSIDNTASKIREKLNTVRNKRKASAKRCIWEMMQNAKDVFNPKYGGVSIEFEIADEHTFVFRHNGLYFELEDVTCLIQQVSSKSSINEDENVTGMFGTGFISTHLRHRLQYRHPDSRKGCIRQAFFPPSEWCNCR